MARAGARARVVCRLALAKKTEFVKVVKIMDSHIFEYYRPSTDESPGGHFNDVIPLHDNPHIGWSEVHEIAPKLGKGWFELSRLSSKDRIDFTMQFWMSKLADQPTIMPFLEKFFASIDDICIFLVQKQYDDPYQAHMVYSLRDEKGFFRGMEPATDNEINQMKKNFPEVMFPKDYLAFLQIHNGFSKATDTGIFRAQEMKHAYEQFNKIVSSKESILQCGERTVDPAELIPFYESFGQPFFQCFWTAWYPEDEMGNVYYSSAANTISCLASKDLSAENMVFTTFSEWLMFYLESVE